MKVVLKSYSNVAYNKKTFYKIPVTLWVYSKKVQIKTLVNLEATTNFINRVFKVVNTDNTPYKAGQINRVCLL